MHHFTFQNPTKVYFGENQLRYLAEELKKYGNRVLLTYGGGSIKKIGLYDQVLAEISKAGLELFELSGIEPNPSIISVRNGAELCKQQKIDVLLAVGGGSTIDATKFIGAAAYYQGDAWDLVSLKAPITGCLPIITILTLAATGSEMNAAGVISDKVSKQKLGLANGHLFPKVSFLDPTLTYSVSPYQTACGTVDMISHILENYFAIEEDLEMLDTAMEGFIRTAIKYGAIALTKGNDYEARANLMWVSTWAQNYFITGAKQPTWLIHSIEHELSAFYDITHGHGLAIVIPRWMEYVLNDKTAPKFKQFGCNVFGIDPQLPAMEVAKQSIKLLADFFFNTLGLKSTLTELGIDKTHFAIMAEKVCGNNTIPSFVPLNKKDVEQIYNMCL